MKKFSMLVMLFLALTFVLVACSEDSGKQSDDEVTNSVDVDSDSSSTENDNMDKNEDNTTDENIEQNDEKDLNDSSEIESQDDTVVEKEDIEPEYTVNPDTWYMNPISDAVDEKAVLLTIDDAPEEYALEMAKTLKELDVGAIFFVNGIYLNSDDGKDMLKKIHNMGFLIGNHTYSHPFLPDLTPEEQKEEIEKVNHMVEDIIGITPKFFRAPNGANTDMSRKLAEENDALLMNWSYGYDWHKEYMSKDAITDIMLNTELLGNGAILLMHDREWTKDALEGIVTGLQDKGYDIIDPHTIQLD